MGTKRIVWLMPDGSKRVTTPGAVMLEGETEAAYLDRVAARTQEVLTQLHPEFKDAVRVADITPAEHVALKAEREAKRLAKP